MTAASTVEGPCADPQERLFVARVLVASPPAPPPPPLPHNPLNQKPARRFQLTTKFVICYVDCAGSGENEILAGMVRNRIPGRRPRQTSRQGGLKKRAHPEDAAPGPLVVVRGQLYRSDR